jgi:drug/metabolite transporter (DMT)-like permease
MWFVGAPETATQPRLPNGLPLAAFACAVLLGGSNFVAVRFSNRELDPLRGAMARFALAAAVFGVLLMLLRLPFPRAGRLPMLAVYGVLAFGVSYGLLYVGMQEVPAGIAAVVMAAGPLLTPLLANAHHLETLHLRAAVGAVVALVAVCLVAMTAGGVALLAASALFVMMPPLALGLVVLLGVYIGALNKRRRT